MSTGQSHIKIDRLTDGNWLLWKLQLRNLLKFNKLQRYIEHEPNPESPEEVADDCRAIGLMHNSLSAKYMFLTGEEEHAALLYRRLEAMFEAQSGARKLEIKQQLAGLRQESKESISDYFARATETKNRATMAGMQPTDDEFKWQILNGIHDKFNDIRTVMEETGLADRTLDSMMARFQIAERRLNAAKESSDRHQVARALAAERVGMDRTKATCHKCGKKGHLRADCRASDADIKKCTYCKKTGHLETQCYRKANDAKRDAEFFSKL